MNWQWYKCAYLLMRLTLAAWIDEIFAQFTVKSDPISICWNW